MSLSIEEKAKILEGKSELEQLGLKAHWALWDLSDYFTRRKDPRRYKANTILRQCQSLWRYESKNN